MRPGRPAWRSTCGFRRGHGDRRGQIPSGRPSAARERTSSSAHRWRKPRPRRLPARCALPRVCRWCRPRRRGRKASRSPTGCRPRTDGATRATRPSHTHLRKHKGRSRSAQAHRRACRHQQGRWRTRARTCSHTYGGPCRSSWSGAAVVRGVGLCDRVTKLEGRRGRGARPPLSHGVAEADVEPDGVLAWDELRLSGCGGKGAPRDERVRAEGRASGRVNRRLRTSATSRSMSMQEPAEGSRKVAPGRGPADPPASAVNQKPAMRPTLGPPTTDDPRPARQSYVETAWYRRSP